MNSSTDLPCISFGNILNFETDFFVLERGQSLVDMDLRLHEEWSPKIEERFFWRKQREFLMEILTKRDGTLSASKIINSIDFETEAILKREFGFSSSLNSFGTCLPNFIYLAFSPKIGLKEFKYNKI